MDRSPFWSQLLRSLNFQPPLSLRNKHIHAVRDSEMHRSVRRGWATTSTLPRYSPIQSLALNFTRSWKRPVPADGVRVAHRAWCLGAASRRARQQLLFEPGRISVLSCCLNSQWVHFIQTLGWSHSNQEDPASLCWAGKEEAGPGRVKKKGGVEGGVTVTACGELPDSNTHILVLGFAKFGFVYSSQQAGRYRNHSLLGNAHLFCCFTAISHLFSN